jgi:ABC-2 type transport system ATP-binding protein
LTTYSADDTQRTAPINRLPWRHLIGFQPLARDQPRHDRRRQEACPPVNVLATNETDLDGQDTDEAPAVRLQKLAKVYKGTGKSPDKPALIDIDLAIPRGCLFGLLGPNGAGKSTLINILAGLVNKTSGKAWVWAIDIDRDPRRARAAIGVVPQELNIDPFFTPRELIEIQAGLYGVPPRERETDDILSAMGLVDKADAYARTLSGGMRRRLMVAKAMVHRPPVLVLDEPTAGVDVELRRQLWAYVQKLNASGVTILLTTHYLQEAEALCERIAIINKGRIVACDRTDALLQLLDGKDLVLHLEADLDALPATLAALGARLSTPRRLVFQYRKSESPVERILDAVRAEGLTIADLSTRESVLEDIFVQLTREENSTDG